MWRSLKVVSSLLRRYSTVRLNAWTISLCIFTTRKKPSVISFNISYATKHCRYGNMNLFLFSRGKLSIWSQRLAGRGLFATRFHRYGWRASTIRFVIFRHSVQLNTLFRRWCSGTSMRRTFDSILSRFPHFWQIGGARRATSPCRQWWWKYDLLVGEKLCRDFCDTPLFRVLQFCGHYVV